ncbi:IMP dehydrogenase [Bacteriovoracaceae bacterium]|nr:IMP dehydrogenase [Bacteriovoracaceae bacterium]
MSLIFTSNQILERARGLTFDDVLMMPNHSQITSRFNPSLSTRLTKNLKIETPIISANMDTISETEMCLAMARLGGVGILHRFMSAESQIKMVKELINEKKNIPHLIVAASVGVKEDGMRRADALADCGIELLTVDIAHGDSVLMYETLEYIKKKYPKIEVIAGNTATFEGVKGLIEHGADAIKVGIGPGSMCTTRIITGCGVPQLTAIALGVEAAKKYDVPIIADGGLKTSGDMAKALAAGASSLMVGSLLSGTLETPGEIKNGMKKYRGMASKDAQVSWRGDLPKGMAPEGESQFIPCKGTAENVVNELTGGIRSSMTYLNAQTINEMKEKARFMEMTAASVFESKPHGTMSN